MPSRSAFGNEGPRRLKPRVLRIDQRWRDRQIRIQWIGQPAEPERDPCLADRAGEASHAVRHHELEWIRQAAPVLHVVQPDHDLADAGYTRDLADVVRSLGRLDQQ